MIQKTITFFVTIYMLVVGFIAAPSQYYLSDFWAYQNLEAGSVADVYIQKLELTEKAKPILAGADPQIKSKSNFNAACQPIGQVVELGCYISGFPDRIYVMQIQDPNIKTVMDVTTAHEFLHAVYARLTPQKKAEIDALVEKQLPLIKDDNLQKRLEGYAKTEPGQQNNELHSIFGTEFSGLLPELENYYKEYFKDRAEIVATNKTNNAYIATKEDALKKQKAQIESENAKLNALEYRMNGYVSNGEITLYNSLVPSQNALVRQINAAIKDYNANIAAYNDLIASINNNTYSSKDVVK